jgi:hypothetical protein
MESCDSLYTLQPDFVCPSQISTDIVGAESNRYNEIYSDFEITKGALEQRISPKNFSWTILVADMLFDAIPGHYDEGDDCLSIQSLDSLGYYDRREMLFCQQINK